ncbi:DUF397 domain-containing protein [Actinomadura sp. GC306]|uniref:DUF397 domain-containing protein n=1 Tax=Actinomadura sp. GC306 TaxID=2530367 RepID=UPI0010441E66|nr:DUF397 domain-containing protein [Actinomadura sp. GC306]TDC70885.1 DUF397 domain-containing protein [Actinomadura sp. GC306]
MSAPSFQWRKSSYSADHPSNCVEVAAMEDTVAARDSKDVSGLVLGFTRDEWRVFLNDAKRGAFDIG